jgi:small multidrug resistance pump
MGSWLLLAVAIVLEVCGTTSMKLSQGFTRWLPSTLIFVFYGLSFTALTFVLRRLEVSVVYAVWSGAGTALIAFIGILWFRESLTPTKVVCLLCIVGGVVGLNLSGGH